MNRLRPLLVPLLVLAVLTVLTVGVLGEWQERQDRAGRDADRRDVTAAASTVARGLTTLDRSSVEDRLADLRPLITGDFEVQFEAAYNTFAKVVTDANLRSTGDVRAVALERLGPDAAVALVAVRAKVVGQGPRQRSTRDYRFRLTLEPRAGNWRVSGVAYA